MSSLPKWKVELLERKRRDEEEGKRREKEELERLARMPAWKREIIERRRARLCSGPSQSEGQGEGQVPGCGFAEGQTGPNLAQAGTGGSEEAGTDRTDPGPGPAACDAKPWEGDAVLRENIGPVYRNRFIQQEKQRRETPEPYSHTLGVKTIWAENIVIIESDPGSLESGGETSPRDAEAPDVLIANQAGGVMATRAADVLLTKSSLSRSVEDLNTLNKGQEDDAGEDGGSRRGRVSRLLCKFGQGRGLIDRPWPTRSRSTENLIERSSRASRSPAPDRPDPRSSRRLGRRGKDSGACPRRPSPSPSPPRTVAAFRSRFEAAKTPEGRGSPDPLPPEPQDQPRDADGAAEETPGSGDPQPLRRRSAQGDGSPAGGEPGAGGTGPGEREDKAEPAAENGRARSQQVPDGDPTPSGGRSRARPGRRTNDPCETRPASPRLEAQAQALAHLRALSKCSFTIVPQRRRAPSPEQRGKALGPPRPGDAAGSLLKPQPVSSASSSCAEQASACVTVAAAAAASCPAAPAQRDADNGSRGRQAELGAARPPLPDLGQGEVPAEEEPGMSRLYSVKPLSAGRARTPAAGPEEGRLPAFSVRSASGPFDRSEKEGAASAPTAQASPAPAPSGGEPPTEQGGPGTEAGGGGGFRAQARSREALAPGSGGSPTAPGKAGRPGDPQRKAGKTITINPRKMAASKAPPPGATATAANGLGPAAGTEPAAEPGKKRYPTAEEIRVIGGYLSPRRSCLAQAGTSRRKLNISFNDCKLESTFEYPSETARLAEFGAGEDEEPPQAREPDEEEEEEDVLIPRLGAPGSPTVGMAIRRKQLLVDESCR